MIASLTIKPLNTADPHYLSIVLSKYHI